MPSWTSLSYAFLSVLTSAKMGQGYDNMTLLAQGLPEYAADAGAADAYVVTLTPTPLAYTAGMRVRFKATNANTGSSTINVNGLGVKTIKKRGGSADLAAGDILAGQMCSLEYDGTNFQLIAVAPPEYAADTGAADAYAVALAPAPAAYSTGMRVRFKSSNANTGTSTLNVNSLGVKTIKKRGQIGDLVDLVRGDILSGQMCIVEYDGTYFQLLGSGSLRPVFSAYAGSSHNVTAATLTKIVLDTEEFDSNGNFDHVTNYRFTPTVPGYYLISGQVEATSNTASSLLNVLVYLYKNGSAFKGTHIGMGGTNRMEGARFPGGPWIVYANGTTDYFEFYCSIDGGGTLSYVGVSSYRTTFNGILL